MPLEGFSGRLLPTDRYNFSNQDGTVNRSRDKVKLPSMAWQWEGDWQIETTLDGQPLDHDVNILLYSMPSIFKYSSFLSIFEKSNNMYEINVRLFHCKTIC